MPHDRTAHSALIRSMHSSPAPSWPAASIRSRSSPRASTWISARPRDRYLAPRRSATPKRRASRRPSPFRFRSMPRCSRCRPGSADARSTRARNARAAAREIYEQAIERGKTAVLHEEVLRGVHMLSIGHIPPGEEIEVSATWAMTLTNVNGSARLRIPLTVGDIYGRSGLPDSDDLAHGGPAQARRARGALPRWQRAAPPAAVSSRASEHPAQCADRSRGQPLDAGRPARARGRRPRGRRCASSRPRPAARALDVAVVIDHSGSMGEVCSAEQPRLTKHERSSTACEKIAERRLAARMSIDLWEFDDACNHVGAAQGGEASRRSPGG